MSDYTGPSLAGTVVLVVLAGIALWIVWAVLSVAWALLKFVLTLAIIGLVVYGVLRLLGKVGALR
jgi:hypothetical protein